MTQYEKEIFSDLVNADYTPQEAMESLQVIRKKYPVAAADDVPTDEYEAKLAARHAEIDQEERKIIMAISAQFKKSRDIDMLFAKYCPHFPLLFLQADR